MKKRGIDDVEPVMVDAWSAGHYGNEPPEDRGKRLVRALCWVRSEPRDNGYARPIENIVAVVDLNRKQLVRVEDYGVVPLPPQAGNWAREYIKEHRARAQAARRVQPKGPSFTVDGHEVQLAEVVIPRRLQPARGAGAAHGRLRRPPGALPRLDRRDDGPLRRSQGVVVPQERLRPGRVRRGHDGQLAGAGLRLPGHDPYFDGHMADSRGRVVTIKNAICLHEEDFGMLWKHTDWRTNQSEVRRSRRLAVSMVATVGNYDYGFYWYFYQDGTIQMEVKLTGIVNTTALQARRAAPLRHGGRAGIDRPVSSALFQRPARLRRRRREQHGPRGQHARRTGRSARIRSRAPSSGRNDAAAQGVAGQRNTNPPSSRFWRIVNPGRKNGMGQPVAYRLCPGENTLPFAQPGASLLKRAAFLTRNLWVTPFDPQGAVPGRRVSQPEPRRRRPAALDSGRPRYRRPRPGRLVHLRPDPHPAARGLAGDAGGIGRVHAPARRLLRPQSGARLAAAAVTKARNRVAVAPYSNGPNACRATSNTRPVPRSWTTPGNLAWSCILARISPPCYSRLRSVDGRSEIAWRSSRWRGATPTSTVRRAS